MKKANHDTTYCISNECLNRENCTRNCVHYEFDLTKTTSLCKNVKILERRNKYGGCNYYTNGRI